MFFLLLVVGAICQGGLMRAVAFRIKQLSPRTWTLLGEPEEHIFSFGQIERLRRNWFASIALRNYVYFKGAYRDLADKSLSRMIWAARSLGILVLLGLAAQFWWLLSG